jgi:hypothetical protein
MPEKGGGEVKYIYFVSYTLRRSKVGDIEGCQVVGWNVPITDTLDLVHLEHEITEYGRLADAADIHCLVPLPGGNADD